MRPFATLTLVAFAASAAGRAIYAPFRSTTVTSLLPALQLREDLHNKTEAAATITTNNGSEPVYPDGDPWTPEPDDPDDRTLTPEEQEAIWCKAKSRGVTMIKAMMMNDQEAAAMLTWPYIQSPWDGDLKPELKKWGYKDDFEGDEDIDKDCDFEKAHDMREAFTDLNINPLSAGKGGPNHCFYVEHMNGPTVIRDEDGELPYPEDQYYNTDGKNYRVTQAYAKIGINPTDGLVYFIHRQSPEDAAFEYWRQEPKGEELPALRSSSDIAWGMWNRVASGLQKLKYFMAVQVVNTESQYIMKRALQQINIGSIPAWPGKDFEFAIKNAEPSESDLLEMEAAFALLGSPNGLGAGYFVVQHRRQLGWKYIWKVKIWMTGTGVWADPNILLYVSDHATFEGPDPERRLDEQLEQLHISQRRKRDLGESQELGVVFKSNDGRNVVREHVVLAKL